MDIVKCAEEAEEKAVSKHGDADLATTIQKIRLAYVAMQKRVLDLEMKFANDKKSPLEDPLACHALHFHNST